jgi:hypothetical protein
MYICEVCKTKVGPGVPSNLVVTETRPKAYPGGSTGYETVKEVRACPSCAPVVALSRED